MGLVAVRNPNAADPAPAATAALVRALRDARCYSHPVDDVLVLETHISYVLLAGEFAYKIKKPLRLPFLDYSSLAARLLQCREELRVNQRTAPGIYRDVVAVTGTMPTPRMGGDGPAIEYAVRMRRFPQEALFDALARRGGLGPRDVEALAREIARLHEGAPRLEGAAPGSMAERVLHPTLDNFRTIEAFELPERARQSLAELEAWTRGEYARIAPRLELRQRQGFVRDGHGDLHLGNVVMLEGRPQLFDAIEFNPEFRRIDTMSDLAFAVVDLWHHGLPELGALLLSTYLEETGDYDGLDVLRFFLVYRALVRAKVRGIRCRQPGLATGEAAEARAELYDFLRLARDLSRRPRGAIVLMHGLSGSGKTTRAHALVEALGAVCVRSDLERKRLLGLAPGQSSQSAPGAGAYAAAATDLTYARLAELAHEALRAGFPVLVDATFLHRAQREAFRRLAEREGVPFAIASCEAPEAVLRERIARRAALGADASEADAAVLDLQLRTAEPLDGAEQRAAVRFAPGGERGELGAVRALERLLSASGS